MERISATFNRRLLQRPTIHVFLIFAVGLVAYSNTFQIPFAFDDISNIVNNPAVTGFRHFTGPSGANAFVVCDAPKSRLVGRFTFALNYKIHGLNVTGYHIFNLAIHILNALLLYWIVTLTFRAPAMEPADNRNQQFTNVIALFSALLFISHPIQTQAVTYIVQRYASLATMFYLLSFACYIKSRLSAAKAKQYLFYGISFVSAVLAMKTKEITFTLPVMIAMYEIMFFKRHPVRKNLYLIPFLLPVFIIPLVLLFMDRPVGSLLSDASEAKGDQDTLSRSDYLFTEFRVIVTYIRLLFFPIRQNLDYDYPVYHSFFDPMVFLSVLFLALIISLGIYILYRYRDSSPHARLIPFGIFWFFIALLVESSIIPINDVIFEHRVYLPSAGAFIAMTASLFAAKKKLNHSEILISRPIILICALIIAVLSGITYYRNSIWQNEISLWSDVVKKSPDKARAHHNLGYAYQSKGMFDTAIEQYQSALRLKPDFAEAHNNLGFIYLEGGLIDKARTEFEMVLRIEPDNYMARRILNSMSGGWTNRQHKEE